ncbi:hypothetical protein B0H17DRAFT_1213429 [Mycena rosella]|uniref:Uncharacterized protein n=1 Tax=Mycena rosella TaxID=1033263 RepID=A0AAD7G5G2_MYCRO|nr:hypothetical protein B0H17DRAFT_1213429 [Mycena rosella]
MDGSPLTSVDDEVPKDILHATEALLGLAAGRSSTETNNSWEDEDEEEESELEYDDDREEKEEELPEIELEFVVPVCDASDTLTLSSTLSHPIFFQNIADEMDIQRNKLNIGYKLSTWTKAERPRKLGTTDHITKLFALACNQLDTKSKKELQIIVINLDPVIQANKKGKKLKPRANQAELSSNILLLTDPQKTKQKAKQDESASDSDGDGQPKKKFSAAFLRDLESTHKCNKHDSHCTVAKNGEHIPLSSGNLSLWSLLLAEGNYTSSTVPPPALGLPLDRGTQAAAPTRCDRGEDGHQFTRFGNILHANGFVRINQLADKGSGGAVVLQEICGEDMKIGIARLMMKYAMKDAKKIRKVAQQEKAEWEAR